MKQNWKAAVLYGLLTHHHSNPKQIPQILTISALHLLLQHRLQGLWLHVETFSYQMYLLSHFTVSVVYTAIHLQDGTHHQTVQNQLNRNSKNGNGNNTKHEIPKSANHNTETPPEKTNPDPGNPQQVC